MSRESLWPVGAVGAVAAAVVAGGAFAPAPALALGGALALLLAPLVPRLAEVPLGGDELLALALIGWGVVTAVANGGSPLAAKETLGGWLAAWLLWTGVRRSGAAARRIATAAVGTATGALAAGVLLEWWGFATPRAGGLVENPNVAAALLVPAVPLVVMALRSPVLRAGSIGLAAAALAATGSRAGLLAAVVAVVVILPTGRHRLAGVAGVVLAAMGLAWWRLVAMPDPLAWHRPLIWRALLDLVRRHLLLGVGPGGLSDAAGVIRLAERSIGQHQFLITYAESTPLGLLVAAGLPGLALGAAAVICWVRRAGQGRVPRYGWAVVAALGALAAVHDMLDVVVVLCWWGVLLGLAEAPTEAPRRLGVERGARLAAVVTGAALAWTLAQPAAARMWLQRGTPDAARVAAVLRLEPFLAAAPETLVTQRLAAPSWSWRVAVETLYWSRRAVQAHPGSAAVWATEARVCSRIVSELTPWPGAVARARRAWREATDREPLLPWYWYEWALLERRVGDLERARALCLRAVAAEPHYARGWLLMARLELDLGRVAAARTALSRAEAAHKLARGLLLTAYERDLLLAPAWQLKELREALG